MGLLKDVTFSVRKTLKSFIYAFKGVWLVMRYENNMRVHLLAALAVLVVGLYFQLSVVEWAIIITQVGLVWAAEIINTALEKLVDLVSPEYHPLAGKVKDMAAGAVLVLSMGALVVGVLIFGSHVLKAFYW